MGKGYQWVKHIDYVFVSATFVSSIQMDQLNLHHPAISPKILHSIFVKATKVSAIKLAQTGRLGRDAFNLTRIDIIENLTTAKQYHKCFKWLPRTLSAARKRFEELGLDENQYLIEPDCHNAETMLMINLHWQLNLVRHIINLEQCIKEE